MEKGEWHAKFDDCGDCIERRKEHCVYGALSNILPGRSFGGPF